MEKYRLGVDIGGTKVGLGLLTEEGKLLRRDVIQTPAYTAGAEAFANALCGPLCSFLERAGMGWRDLDGFGVGIPGTADCRRGVARYCPNLFGAAELPLADLLEARLGVRPHLVQDSWAAAYAEFVFGRQRTTPNMLCVTVGTGIGCGVILNGRVFGGALGTAGELGHVPIVFDGRPCACGRRGCLERYVSGTAILAQAMEAFPQKLAGLPPKAESVFSLAYEGDADALALIAQCADKLAYGLALAIDLLAVDTVILSGGVSAHKELLIDPLEKRIRGYAYPPWADSQRLQVLPAALGADAPLVGAAFLTPDQIW